MKMAPHLNEQQTSEVAGYMEQAISSAVQAQACKMMATMPMMHPMTMMQAPAHTGYPMAPISPMGATSSSLDEDQTGAQPQLFLPSHSKSETERPASPTKPAKKQDLKKYNKNGPVPAEEATTLMIRGIPCSFSQESLMSIIDDAGLKGKYNFFYLPRDGSKSANLGYAFINFVDQKSADLCTSTFKGVPLARFRSAKTCSISPAAIQGLPALKKHFRNTAVGRGSCTSRPVFLKV